MTRVGPLLAAHDELRRLRGIGLDVAAEDEYPQIAAGTRLLSQELASFGIPHAFEIYAGGTHRSMIREHIETRVLPFSTAPCTPVPDAWRTQMIRNVAVNSAAILFAAVSIAHLLRIVFGVPVTVADESIPMWVSVIGVVVPGVLAWLLYRNPR